MHVGCGIPGVYVILLSAARWFVKISQSVRVFLCLLFLLLPLNVHAADSFSADQEEGSAAFGLEGWLSRADAKWQISFPYQLQYSTLSASGFPAGTTGKIESELTFKKIDSPLYIFTTGSRIDQDISFDVMYGAGSISGGRGTDEDRFIADSGKGIEFSESQNSLNGDVRQWGLNFYYNNKRFTNNQNSPWGMVLGYLHYTDRLRMTNAVQVVSTNFENMIFPPPGPFPQFPVFDSTYDFTWDLFKVGVLYQPRLTQSLSLTGSFSVYPYVSYEGDGYWNLRTTGPDAFRSQSPNFTQTATSGYGYEASLGLTYAVMQNLELFGGYRYFYLYAQDGTDTTYFADGTQARSNLDWVTVTRQGAYAGAAFKF